MSEPDSNTLLQTDGMRSRMGSESAVCELDYERQASAAVVGEGGFGLGEG